MASPTPPTGKPTLSINWQPYNIVSNWTRWFAISAVVILIGIGYMAANVSRYGAPFKLGIDFLGGVLLSQSYADEAAEKLGESGTAGVEDLVSQYDSHTPTIQLSEPDATGQRTLLIRASADLAGPEGAVKRTALREDLVEAYGEPVPATTKEEVVSPTISGELINKAFLGLFWGNLLVFLYITVRMRLDFAAFGIVALLHDLLVTVGFMAAMSFHFGWEVNSWFVAVILTILGYSINDTIVIYDRIRENLKLYPAAPFPTIVNFSLVQTMTRSINTSVTVVLVLVAMLVGQAIAGGSGGLMEFNATLLAGVISGVYSTIFIAAQLLVAWYKRREALGQLGFIADKSQIVGVGADPASVVAHVRDAQPRREGEPLAPRRLTGAEIVEAAKAGVGDVKVADVPVPRRQGPKPASAGGRASAKKKRW